MSYLQRFLGARLSLNSEPCDPLPVLAELQNEFFAPPGRVCIRDTNPLRFALKYLMLLEAGSTPILVAAETPPAQLQRLVERQSAGLWDKKEFRAGVAGPGEGAYACLTSGTTGDPKLSWHSIEGAQFNANAHAEHLGITAENNLVQALPLSHGFGIVCYLWVTLVRGNALNLLTSYLTPASWNKLVNPQSVVYLSPALARLLLKNRSELTVPAGVSVGGGLFHADEFQALQQRFPAASVYVTYGFTEAGPRTSSQKISPDFVDRSIGYALPGTELRVLVEGKLQRSGRGRLAVNTPSAKLNILPGEVVDGFLLSGDEVELHPDGRVHYFDRGDDLIKVGGISVYPSDILTAFHQIHPKEEAVVFKEAHAIYGEVPVLVIERDGEAGNTQEELAVLLSNVQLPRKIVTLKQFPRNSFGKIDRKAIRSGL